MRPVGVLAEHRDAAIVLDPRIEHDAIAHDELVDTRAERRDDAGPVRSQDPGLRYGREAHADPDVEVVERRRREADEHLAVTGSRVGYILVPQDLRAALLVDANRLQGHNPRMTAAELACLADELGLDVVGAAPAAAYDETEAHIRERKEQGLFAGMKFTMAQPGVSCHPELLLDGEARTVVSAALCYWTAADEPGPGEGRLPRDAWRDHYALLRERLDALGRGLGGRYRVLVDENQHVDREGARRAGLGFYGKNTMLITRDYGSWVVLGTVVTDVEIEASKPLELDCGRCRLCIDACPTGALAAPGGGAERAWCVRCPPLPLLLDTGAGRSPRVVPRGARRVGVRVRHLPGRLPLESWDREAAPGRATACRRGTDGVAPGVAGGRRSRPRCRRRPALCPTQ